MAGGIFKRRNFIAAAITVTIILSLASVFVCGCAESREQKQKDYRVQWQDSMNAFEERVAADDEKAQKLIEENDTAGVIKLIEERVENVWDVYDEIVVLDPPDDLRRLHALTLYYLTTVVEQLEAQNALNEAVLSGKPVTDLKTIAEEAVQMSAYIIGQLALEVEKTDVKLKSMEDQRPDVQENQGTLPSEDEGGQENSGEK